MEKTAPNNQMISKERERMNTATKKKVTGWTVGLAACAVLSFGIYTMNQQPDAEPTTTPPPSTAIAPKPPITGKAVVNIDGVISEVSADGKSFKVGDLWVTVTPETKMGIDGPTAAEPSEDLLQKEFKVGNSVSGFTTEDVSTGKVKATRIYNNIAPQK
ncbi:hypothetical protein [Cohnella sp. REN36]|nr:hypothetical protein [Cohnella sp. REN36]